MGFSADLAFIPDANLGIVILTNAEGAGTFKNAIRSRFFELVFGQAYAYDAIFEQGLARSRKALTDFASVILPDYDKQVVELYMLKLLLIEEMSNLTFNPYHLRPLASLNRRKIIALKGVEPEIIGRTGYEVASKPALIALIRSQAQSLGLEEVDEQDYPPHFNALLESPNARLRIASEAIAARHGCRVGYLIASILLSPHGLTEPLDPWEGAYLRCWREKVGTLFLGGGLTNGRLGQIICASLSDVLGKCGLSDIQVQAAEHTSYLPLIGAARGLPACEGRLAVVADFGGTQAKRGLAFYAESGALQRLEGLPPGNMTTLNEAGETAELAEAMIHSLADVVKAAPAGITLFSKILCSVAAYVEAGKPLNEDRGGYYALNQLSPDLCTWIAGRISQACGKEVQVEFLHDCDAAAVALAGRERSAVLMLGSALGVGFVPPVGGYRPLSSSFEIIPLHPGVIDRSLFKPLPIW